MTSLSKLSPLGHLNYAIRSLVSTKNNLEKTADGVLYNAELKTMIAVADNMLAILKKERSKLHVFKRPQSFRVRPLMQTAYTLSDSLDAIAVMADPLRKRIRTLIELVIQHYGIDYATLTSARRKDRVMHAKKAITIGLKEYMGLPSRDISKLIGINISTINYHIRTQIASDIELFRSTFIELANGEYNFENESRLVD